MVTKQEWSMDLRHAKSDQVFSSEEDDEEEARDKIFF
jgi:hypothetical protein